MDKNSALLLFLSIVGAFLIKGNLQEEVNDGDVTFYVYSTQNNESYEYLNESDIYDVTGPKVIVLIHGWTESREDNGYYEPIKDVFLAEGDSSVIQVDYGRIAALDYVTAVSLSTDVANIIADLIIDINDYVGIAFKNFHLIGHSLGGQIAGFVGKRVISETNSTIGKITGLDPAGPLFFDGFRLVPTDAEIVEVVHTDGFVNGYYGTSGTVDFYPNGGTAIQPGCPDTLDDIVGCSHHRSYKYYVEALQYGGFTSTECTSYLAYQLGTCDGNNQLNIGGNITKGDSGTYYLTTNSESLFSKG